MEKEVLPSNDIGARTVLRKLSWYMNNLRYTQDIFILIFCQEAHKLKLFSTEYVDKHFLIIDNGITNNKEVVPMEQYETNVANVMNFLKEIGRASCRERV